jgi:hypothetical protein
MSMTPVRNTFKRSQFVIMATSRRILQYIIMPVYHYKYSKSTTFIYYLHHLHTVVISIPDLLTTLDHTLYNTDTLLFTPGLRPVASRPFYNHYSLYIPPTYTKTHTSCEIVSPAVSHMPLSVDLVLDPSVSAPSPIVATHMVASRHMFFVAPKFVTKC